MNLFRRSFVLIQFFLVLFLFNSCTTISPSNDNAGSDVSGDPKGTDSLLPPQLEPPTEVPADGYWVLFQFYTIDEITPRGELTLRLFDGVDTEIDSLLTQGVQSEIQGASLHQVWYYFKQSQLEWPKGIHFKIFSPTGAEAILLDGTRDPNCRKISLYYGGTPENTWSLDPNKRQSSYHEVIRHWDDSPIPDTVTVTGTLINERREPVNGLVDVGFLNPDGPRGGGIIQPLSIHSRIEGGELSIDLPVRTFKDDTALNDWGGGEYYITAKVDHFMAPNLPADRMRFSALGADRDGRVNLGNIIMYANRIITFNWAYSPDGTIPVTAPIEKGKAGGFEHYRYHESDSMDLMLGILDDLRLFNLNEYILDTDVGQDSSMTDLEVNFNPYRHPLAVEFHTEGIEPLGKAPIREYFGKDLSTFPYTTSYGYVHPVEENDLYAIKTTDGGYALVKVTSIEAFFPD